MGVVKYTQYVEAVATVAKNFPQFGQSLFYRNLIRKEHQLWDGIKWNHNSGGYLFVFQDLECGLVSLKFCVL